MKKISFLILLTCLISGKVFAVEIDMITKVEAVTVYHSGALVIRNSINDLKPGVNELVFKNLSSKIILNSLKVTNKEVTVLNKSIIRKLTAEEFDQLLDQKTALNTILGQIMMKLWVPETAKNTALSDMTVILNQTWSNIRKVSTLPRKFELGQLSRKTLYMAGPWHVAQAHALDLHHNRRNLKLLQLLQLI